VAQSALACSHNPALACRLRIVNLYPPSEHEVHCSRLQSPVIATLRQACIDQPTLIVRQSIHSPCLIKKLARTSPANACFIALGFLGYGLACMIH
jgi:hypothetical protein